MQEMPRHQLRAERLQMHICCVACMELASAGAPDTSEEAPGTADAAVVSALSAVDSRLAAGNAAASAEAAAPRSVGSAESALATLLGTASKPAICGVLPLYSQRWCMLCSMPQCAALGRAEQRLGTQPAHRRPRPGQWAAQRAGPRHAARHHQQACSLRRCDGSSAVSAVYARAPEAMPVVVHVGRLKL